jgi:uncharacterized protein (TIGR02145 family)
MGQLLKIRILIVFYLCSVLSLTSCKEKPTPPSVTTSSVTDITQTTATVTGNVTSDGNDEVTSRGICWNSSQNPTISNNITLEGTGAGTFTSSITQLMPDNIYYVRAFATNSVGTGYGNEVSFTTNPVIISTLTTTSVTSITLTSAVSGGNITNNGGGALTARGVCWSTTTDPTINDNRTTNGNLTGSFVSNITGLQSGTTYYLRAYATNSAGISYGNQVSFKTMACSVTDIDGNIYYGVIIGNQTWMAENLKTTRYCNGDQIPDVNDENTWNNLSTDAMCTNIYIDNYSTIYGLLYNWYAVKDDREICPSGWHVPLDEEWTTLTTYLGGENIAGGKLKEKGTSHWISPNLDATNESGFTALPTGIRGSYGFDIALDWGFWWSASEYDTDGAWHRIIFTYDSSVDRTYNNKKNGFSVRCIKDQ